MADKSIRTYNREKRVSDNSRRICNIICLIFTAVFFSAVTLGNILQKERPTFSESEKRELAKPPVISAEALADGSFASGLGLYFSDTFLMRDSLVEMSGKLDRLKGVSMKFDGDDFSILVPGGNKTADETTAPAETTAPNETAAPVETTAPDETASPDVTESPETSAPAETTAHDVGSYDGEAEFFSSGLFIYGKAVYMQAAYVESYARKFFNAAKALGAAAGIPAENVTVLAVPASSMVLDDKPIANYFQKQRQIFEQFASVSAGISGFANAYPAMFDHKNEYLYFRTDHHWTALGAYYAYTAFAESRGFVPTPLESFTVQRLNSDYHGSYYSYTNDPRVLEFSDEIDAYMPTKPCSMTVYGAGGTAVYGSCIVPGFGNYCSFICGDNPCTVIDVPDNPSERSILVFKDSFGCAFVPFLCEHYGKIVVIDPRYYTGGMSDILGISSFSDILIVNSVVNMWSATWSDMYETCAGA